MFVCFGVCFFLFVFNFTIVCSGDLNFSINRFIIRCICVIQKLKYRNCLASLGLDPNHRLSAFSRPLPSCLVIALPWLISSILSGYFKFTRGYSVSKHCNGYIRVYTIKESQQPNKEGRLEIRR